MVKDKIIKIFEKLGYEDYLTFVEGNFFNSRKYLLKGKRIGRYLYVDPYFIDLEIMSSYNFTMKFNGLDATHLKQKILDALKVYYVEDLGRISLELRTYLEKLEQFNETLEQSIEYIQKYDLDKFGD